MVSVLEFVCGRLLWVRRPISLEVAWIQVAASGTPQGEPVGWIDDSVATSRKRVDGSNEIHCIVSVWRRCSMTKTSVVRTERGGDGGTSLGGGGGISLCGGGSFPGGGSWYSIGAGAGCWCVVGM